jgi:pyrroline-5-carboxylate reductase
MLKGKNLVIIGVGKMGEALVKGILKNKSMHRDKISGTVAHEKSLQRVRKRLDINVSLNNQKTAAESDIIIIAVKPQNMEKVLLDIVGKLTPGQLVISVAASVSCGYVEERLQGKIPVIRAMPNMASMIGQGMTGLSSGKYAENNHLKIAESIFKSVGETAVVDENLMDGVTGLSASGPAFLYVVVESLAEAGVKLGIPRNISTLLAAQTMLGTAQMVLESKEHPALLKDQVTTPAGCTVDGLMELEEGKLRVTLIKAVVKAAGRAKELVYKQNSL